MKQIEKKVEEFKKFVYHPTTKETKGKELQPQKVLNFFSKALQDTQQEAYSEARKEMKKKKLLIEWSDASVHTGWYDDLDEVIKKCPDTIAHTLGWYVGETKGYLILSVHYCPADNMKKLGHAIWIPKSCIISKKEL